MSKTIKTDEGLFIQNERRIDLNWIVKANLGKGSKSGHLNLGIVRRIPGYLIGKRVRIKIEPCNQKQKKK